MNILNNEKENLLNEKLNNIYKRVSKEIMKKPDETYKEEIEYFLLSAAKEFLDANKLIFKNKIYLTNTGKTVSIKDFLQKNMEKLVTQFKLPLKLNREETDSSGSSNNNKAFNPVVENILNDYQTANKSTVRSFFTCCLKSKKKRIMELEPLEMHTPIVLNRVNNSSVHLKQDISKIEEINKSPQVVKKSPKKARSSMRSQATLTLLDNISPETAVYKHARVKLSLYLVKDIIYLINNLNKQSHKVILHQYTFTNNSYAVIKDYTYLAEYFIRTNLESISKNKKISYPLLTNGSIYVPGLLYIRHSIALNYDLLVHPISIPLILTQLLDFDDDRKEYNDISISQNIQFTDLLGYDTVLVNMIGVGGERSLCDLFDGYFSEISKLNNSGVINFYFIFDCGVENLAHVYKVCIETLLNKYNFKIEIIVYDNI
jgi:hypothetical protein